MQKLLRSDAGKSLLGQRGGRVFDAARLRCQIGAGADHDEIDRVAVGNFRLEQDSGEFAAGGENVVRPFAANLESRPAQRTDRLRERERRDKAELGGARRGDRRGA